MHRIEIPAWAVERGLAMRTPRAIPPERTAVLVVDMQMFFIADEYPLGSRNAQAIIANVNRLTRGYRAAGATVIFLQHSFAPPAGEEPVGKAASALSSAETRAALQRQLLPGTEAFAFHPQVEVAAEDVRLVKRTASAFHPRSGCDLNGELASRGIEQLVIAGLVTNGCCECNARDAHQHGFQVQFVADATAALTDEEHNAALLNLAIMFAQVPLTADLLATLPQAAAA